MSLNGRILSGMKMSRMTINGKMIFPVLNWGTRVLGDPNMVLESILALSLFWYFGNN